MDALNGLRNARSCAEAMRCVFESYTSRPMLGTWDEASQCYTCLTYGQVWERVQALATGVEALPQDAAC